MSPVPRGRPRSHGRGGPPRVPPGRERAGEAPRVGPRRARIGIPRRRLPHLRQHAVGRPDVPDARYRRTREAQAQVRSARLRRSRGGRGREPEKSDAKESRGGGRREMKKTKRLFLSSCLPRQAVGGRGGGRARERRGDRKERERKNDATRRCVCQRREKGPIGEAGAATRETKIDTRPREKASPFQVAARCLAVLYESDESRRDEPVVPGVSSFFTVGAARSPEFLKFILTFLPSWSRRCRVFVDASSSLPPHV